MGKNSNKIVNYKLIGGGGLSSLLTYINKDFIGIINKRL